MTNHKLEILRESKPYNSQHALKGEFGIIDTIGNEQAEPRLRNGRHSTQQIGLVCPSSANIRGWELARAMRPVVTAA